ncbi:MAG: hypothetical protein U5R06_01310 [candidate division KSB1 bacterium]|nr:hypothetical protein [candidate division KSB1 bacterium]
MAMQILSWLSLLQDGSNFFSERKVNIFEILVLFCFVMGMGMLIYAAFGVVQSLIDFNLIQVAVIVGFIYMTWTILWKRKDYQLC